MKNKSLITVIGFLLLIFGVLSLLLSLTGLKFTFLAWIDALSPMFGFIAKLVMILGGIIMIVLSRSNFEGIDD